MYRVKRSLFFLVKQGQAYFSWRWVVGFMQVHRELFIFLISDSTIQKKQGKVAADGRGQVLSLVLENTVILERLAYAIVHAS